MAPVVEAVSQELSDQVQFYDVDVDKLPDLASKFGVMSIPTMVLFHNGIEQDRVTGAIPEAAVKQFALR
ncbi:thioredoxin family protein [Microaerobacter geothermalis]|uniref:thioredoxin family protein n=1 Tax=Microaerobacter geothermalis TaxID=674972 RepID=UPI001F3C1371|nr:thioredoxin domain-containing protein [Microaerobacter geothermalis]MCF6095212.1 thioredoxin family protein [Microaerobacter geothermalis]